MAEAYREESLSEAEVHLGSLLHNCAEITSKVGVRDHLVTIGLLPNVNSIKQIRDANSVICARLRTGKLKIKPAKNRRRMVTKMKWPH